MKINGVRLITVNEMAEEEETSTNTIKQRIFNHGIKPISKDALYYYSDFEKIKDVKVGRPSTGIKKQQNRKTNNKTKNTKK